jgi:pyruvoyl-dependent arginine decarboxylase (PvlArgDC)
MLSFAVLVGFLLGCSSSNQPGRAPSQACKDFTWRIEDNYKGFMSRFEQLQTDLKAKQIAAKVADRMMKRLLSERVMYLQTHVISATPATSGCSASQLEALQEIAKREMTQWTQTLLGLEAEK